MIISQIVHFKIIPFYHILERIAIKKRGDTNHSTQIVDCELVIFEKFLRVYYSYFIRRTCNKLALTFLDLAKFFTLASFRTEDAKKTVILLLFVFSLRLG